ncbi:uncharacterized protein LOC141754638 [Sebastes fasciatus]|uniref:uncharacterized protein LOC141754638 n=1 Tax=Sebastes fasciatus TaxID=394691 RepID=UPI003D9DF573
MESIMSLGAPLKQFTSCMSGKSTSNKRRPSQSVRRSSFTRRKSVSRRRSLPCNPQKVPDSWLRMYQADLKRERKRQQAILAKKNAERVVRKTHFRSHHCLPRHTTSARRSAKDESFFGAFQGLSLDGLMGGSTRSPAISMAPAGGGDQCNVM